MTPLAERYLAALLAGDDATSRAVLDEAWRDTSDPLCPFEEVMTPALHAVGRLWREGRIGEADEHLATQIAWAHLDHLAHTLPSGPSRGRTVLVGTVEGEQHVLPARMVADAFALDGWTVAFLGGGLPPAELAAFAERRGVDLVALSVSNEAHTEAAHEAVRALRALERPPAVLLGGGAAQGDALRAVDADGLAPTLRDGVGWAREWAAREGHDPPLAAWLAHLGERVRTLRAQRGWSQGVLAEAAGLHRAYVSAVEGGKQNVTIGAVLKLAGALGVSLPDLLSRPVSDEGSGPA